MEKDGKTGKTKRKLEKGTTVVRTLPAFPSDLEQGNQQLRRSFSINVTHHPSSDPYQRHPHGSLPGCDLQQFEQDNEHLDDAIKIMKYRMFSDCFKFLRDV